MKKDLKINNTNTKSESYLADWIAGNLSDSELKELVSDADFLTYTKMRQAFDLFEKPSFTNPNFSELQNKLKAKQPVVKKLITNWAYAVAASFVLYIGVYQFLQADITHITHSGQIQEIALNEGTSIELNAQSTLKYSKYQSQREVSLNGEAFFKVTKKGAFSVNTSYGVIEVLGTEFNVISHKDYLEVICYEGKVAVNSQNKKWILTPHNAWRSIKGEIKTWNTKKTTASWLHGESSFTSTPLTYVLLSIENQYNVKFSTNKLDTTTLFTGSYTHKNLETALKSICLPLGLSFEIKDNATIILSKK